MATQLTMSASDVTFQAIKDAVGNSLDLHIVSVDNGHRVHARTKITMCSGLVHTKYLYAVMVGPDGKVRSTWREQKDGTFKQV